MTKSIGYRDMTQVSALADGDLLAVSRVVSGVEVPVSVPPSAFLKPGDDLGEQSVSWEDPAGDIQDATIASLAALLSFFTVSQGQLCVRRSMLPTNPTQDGALFDNGGQLAIFYKGSE